MMTYSSNILRLALLSINQLHVVKLLLPEKNDFILTGKKLGRKHSSLTDFLDLARFGAMMFL